jgi:hypothetical protein
MFAAAVEYHLRGWRVMPLPYGEKFPPLRGWSEDNKLRPEIRSANENTFRRWWLEEGPYQGGNIALCCGLESGVFILDIDGPEGESAIAGKELPIGPQVKTVHGRHIYFRYPASLVIPPKVGLKKKLDIRGRGAYALMPPSKHPDGPLYEWEEGTEKLDVPDAPAWLLDWITAASPRDKPKTTESRRESAAIAETLTEGGRNDGLFRLACRLRGAGLTENSIEDALQTENKIKCKPPLPEFEVVGIARSACKYPPGLLSQAIPPPSENDYIDIAELIESEDFPIEPDSSADYYSANFAGSEEPANFGYSFNDSGNAQRLFDRSGDDMLFCPSWSEWVVWNGEIWERAAGHKALELAQGVSKMLYAQAENITAMLDDGKANTQTESATQNENEA